MRLDDIAAIDGLPRAVAFLINDGPVLPELTRSRAQTRLPALSSRKLSAPSNFMRMTSGSMPGATTKSYSS